MTNTIELAKSFTTKPGPRHIDEGDFSGELFRQDILIPAYDEARDSGSLLSIDLNGTEGYATSFLEEAFGGLARIYGEANVLQTLVFTCDDDPFLIEEIKQYIHEANASRN